ncbi:tRNA (adenosine(37)-N6)-threonylcarbamoyltransferase complex dimerization subunit type 1 TsaB [Lunatibacter salilacus]|uniref:tRNA (adenosine(37)-N6)-threonylcarbamoyltransferase complex dimerization subunit type 1 TsaB n=1 Tax=Lunatibacter salilacus TaxID=2483804 RepID=UPI00131C9745|nr:tRNA (adenosine(37)-N6)-threonylcarbamoyltransferase complex dimerization subunit type 1 TsaB [Lunatibacter salilacus]
MGLILSIETAVSVCSVAVHDHGRLVGILEVVGENVHGRKLVPLIQGLLTHTGISKKDLTAVSVSKGPGSYTGLRIGVSTAKGLAYALDIPLIGVDTLEAMARGYLNGCTANDVVIPMLDARRMEVYAKIIAPNGEMLLESQPIVVGPLSFGEYMGGGRTFFVGDACDKVSSVIKHSNAVFIQCFPSARTVGELAYEKYHSGDFEDIAYFEPNYLKEFMVIKSKKNVLNP